MKVVDGLRVRFKPSEADLVDAYEYGYQFGCTLQNKENPKKRSARKTLVKCVICGEIFDSSVEVCPVCGAGREHFVPVEAEETAYHRDTKDFYVMLTKSIMADLQADQIAIENQQWYEENNIIQVLGREVIAIDTQSQEVELEDGTRLRYSKLIYALGSECFIPPIPGTDKKQVVAIRRLSDTQKIAALLPGVKNVVVIGGGVLGLEAAWELRKAKCKVTVLELSPQLMGRQLDEPASEMLRLASESQGIEILTGVQIVEIQGDDKVTGVCLGDQKVLPADLVIVSCGVRANVGIAQKTGIQTDRAVLVNDKMETNISGIYACGDCAEYQGINYAIWPEASEQGKVAGANAAGDDLSYNPVPAALNFHGMNTALYAAGDNGKNSNLVYKTVEYKDMAKKQYQKLYFLNNRLCGVILIGDVSKMAELSQALEEHAPYQKVMR